MHKFLFYKSVLYASTRFEHYVLIIRRSKLYYKTSGIITLVGGIPVHRCTGRPPTVCDDTRHCIIQYNTIQTSGIITLCRWPSGAQVHGTTTYRV